MNVRFSWRSNWVLTLFLLTSACTQSRIDRIAQVTPISPSSPGSQSMLCPSGSSDRSCQTFEADLNGDGELDTARLSSANSSQDWSLTVKLGGKSSVFTLPIDPALDPRFIGAVDADGLAGEELFVELDHGATTVMAGIFSMSSGRLLRVQKDGLPLVIRLGGSVRHGNGAECLPAVGPDQRPGMALLGVSTDDEGMVAEWIQENHVWVDGSLELVDKSSGTFDATDESRLQRFYRIRCGSLDVSV